jgi:hypothetical protein
MRRKNRKRFRPPFWRRKEPLPRHDITKRRPHDGKKGHRFETTDDARIENERSELLLKQARGPGRKLAKGLQDCREDHHRCDQTYCPLCARVFRRWFIGELLRLSEAVPRSVATLTLLLKEVHHDRIDKLHPEDFRGMLRQRLVRAGLADAVVIGAFENIYRARGKEWVLHVNLIVIDGRKAAIDKFKESFVKSDIERPVMELPLNDPAEQLSYVPKFTTYHRPYERSGAGKGSARPLNPQEHLALVQWMAKRSFKDFMFLFNARQSFDSIVPHTGRLAGNVVQDAGLEGED